MKQEIYSIIKILESLNDSLIKVYNSKFYSSARNLRDQYNKIISLLNNHLDDKQIEYIPTLSEDPITYDDQEVQMIQELIVATDIAVAYLNSIDMNIDKELSKKKGELQQKEDELKLKEKEMQSYKKLLKDSLEAIKQFPELQRSRTVEEIKKSHRSIEQNTRK